MKTRTLTLLILSFFMINMFNAIGQNDGFRKHPYILLKQDTVTIMWQLYDTLNCTFKYKKASNSSFTNMAVNTPYIEFLYKYELTNLDYNTLYEFKVLLADGNQDSGSFLSPPLPTAQQISFYGYGDTRGDNESSHPPFHDEVCEQVVAEIDNSPESQTLIIHAGDWNVNDKEIAWDSQYFYKGDTNAIALRTKIGVVGCIGNHEANTGEAENYRKYWPYDYPVDEDFFWYSYDYGPVHFCFADQRWQTSSLSDADTQKTWIRNDLEMSNKPWKILVFHPPVYTLAKDPSTFNSEKTFFDGICDSTEKYGVNLVLNGHVHEYSNWLVNGVHHLTLGGGGASRYPGELLVLADDPLNPNIIRFQKDWHFAKFDVTDDYIRVKVPLYDSIWEIFDEFIIPHSFTIKSGESIVWEDHGVHYYADEIRIEDGGLLTIKGNVEFQRDGKIIIEPGGQLTVDSALLSCLGDETHWQGIQVWGNKTENQFEYSGHPLAQGKLVLTNGATIENAIIGVDLWNPDHWGTTGGMVFADGAIFRNNAKSVHALPYRNYHPIDTVKEVDYFSNFKNCKFEITQDYHNAETFYKHIDLASVRGIGFQGCVFSLADNVAGVSQWNSAIASYDAGFAIKGACEVHDIYPCPTGKYHNSTFDGFHHAIHSSNGSSVLYQIFIRESDFTNNGYGIYFSAVNDAVVLGNKFELGTYDCNHDAGTGIFLDNCKRFAIENNSFKLPENAMSAHYVGIHTINTNNAFDEIYKNDFDNMIVANFAEGKNWLDYKEKGLAYYCNTNQNNDWDFVVEKKGDINNIQLLQGSKSYPAGNTFSTGATKHFYNNGDDEVTYYHENGNSSQTPTLLYRVEPKPIQYTNTCPSHYGSGGNIRMSTTEYQQRENGYNNALVSYNTASTNYIAANDSTARSYWADEMSYYNMQMARAAYDIIRSDLADTVAHPDKFKTWMNKLNTYVSDEAMVDYYLQQGDYATALNKVDSLPNRFTFTAYDSIEYPMYKDFKHHQSIWLDQGRTVFDLTTTEINSLIAIADSSKGMAGAQARGILLFAYDSVYSYVNCIGLPGSSNKSAEFNNGSENKNSKLTISVKPNPAGNSVTFYYTLLESCTSGVVELYDNSGKIVKQINIPNNGTKTMDCSGLPSGIYIYRFVAGNTVSSGKLVIKH